MKYNIVRNGKDNLPKHNKQSRKCHAMLKRRGVVGTKNGGRGYGKQ